MTNGNARTPNGSGKLLPYFFDVKQSFPSFAIPDVRAATREAIEASAFSRQLRAGQTVAIAVGSRGMNQLPTIVRAVVDFITQRQATAVIVPAMGSHGGATAIGQSELLASLGVSSESMGCEIRASMETIELGTSRMGIPIHFDKLASQSDHIVMVNRIKPHTRLAGQYESGLVKMLLIGLGKHNGAIAYHQAFDDANYCLDELARELTPLLLDRTPTSLGLGVIEDAYDQVSQIDAIDAENLLSEEPKLLSIARERMPRLPFAQIDLLIVDRIGKEISGTGLDTNVVGRKWNDKVSAANEFPKVKQIYVRSLSEKTAGNATGIGVAEFCHRQVLQRIDYEKTRINCLTSMHARAGAIPIHFESDRDALTAARTQAGPKRMDQLKWVRIVDTLRLSEISCSEGLWEEVRHAEAMQAVSEPSELQFDAHGDFLTEGD